MRVVALAGGVGGSKLVLGLYRVLPPDSLTVVANTGDDIVLHGLHVCPDPDIVVYTLAGIVNEDTGWGIRDETWNVAAGLARYGRPTWFQLGDRDVATHIHRSALLKEGCALSGALDAIRQAHGIRARILPMSDDFAPTFIETDGERIHLQDYFVRLKCAPRVRRVVLENAARAKPAPGVLEAILQADAIVLAPSNPLISIGPILAVEGLRQTLRQKRDRVCAVCPLVGGRSLKGPSDKMMAELGYDVSARGIAELYRDIAASLVIDNADAGEAAAIALLGIEPIVRPTVMRTLSDKKRLARDVLALFA